MQTRYTTKQVITCLLILLLSTRLYAFEKNDTIKVKWDSQELVSKTTPTLQLVENPAVRQSPIHEATFKALKNLGADYVRYVPWFPYPKLAVAELKPPSATKTSWDFSLIDPMTIDFLEATKGHSVIMNFSTIPQWMFKTDYVVSYPADPNELGWSYGGGSEFRDSTMKELTGYYE